jgi:Protein of unknown function (DUF3788)
LNPAALLEFFMALSAFIDKSHPPTDDDLRPVLGRAHEAWARLIELVTARIDQILPVWGFTSEVTGWGLRLKRKGRVILYMTPRKGHFLVSFALGEKAVAAAHAKRLPASVLKTIDSSPRYAEGRGVRFEVQHSREVSALATLAKIKNDH